MQGWTAVRHVQEWADMKYKGEGGSLCWRDEIGLIFYIIWSTLPLKYSSMITVWDVHWGKANQWKTEMIVSWRISRFLVTVELRWQPGMSPPELDGFEMHPRKNKPNLIWFFRNEINSSCMNFLIQMKQTCLQHFKLLFTPFHAVCTQPSSEPNVKW